MFIIHTMRKVILPILLIIILLTSCSKQNTTGSTVIDVIIPEEKVLVEKGSIELYFCPKDDCSKVLENLINSGEKSVHCAFYDLRLQNVVKVLARKSHDIDVKVVVDNNNYGYITGGGVKKDNNEQLMHNKFCIIDGRIVSTGSFNPTENGAFKNNNNLVVIKSSYLAENYEDEFNELWNGRWSRGEKVINPEVYVNNVKIENYFCPEDNCKKHVIEEIKKAKESIYFMTFSFTDEEIADAILFSDVTDIKGVFEKLQAGGEYSQYKRLKDFGLDVKLDNNPYNMHHKVFIIDKKVVITGSYNPTGAGQYKNDENILIIYDKEIAQKFLEEFESLW